MGTFGLNPCTVRSFPSTGDWTLDSVAQFIVPAIFSGIGFLQAKKTQDKQAKAQKKAQEQALAVQQSAVEQQRAQQSALLEQNAATERNNAITEAENAQRASQDLALREQAFQEENIRIAEAESTLDARETAIQTRENAKRKARSGRNAGRRSLIAPRPGGVLGLPSDELLGRVT